MTISKRWFGIHISDDIARSMTRAEYYACRSYLRRCEWIIAQEMARRQ